MIEHIQLLMIQLSVITVSTWLGGLAFRKMRMPTVLGEMLAGVAIGPFALGGIAFLSLEHGLFPVTDVFPVSTELYGLATLASIVLLFYVGLETDLDTFMKFSIAGSTIGLFGGILSFCLGNFAGSLYLEQVLCEPASFSHPICLFFGVISTATSVSITARLLLDKRRMNAPDGVTILSAAVIDDIVGIVTLAVIVGLSANSQLAGGEIVLIAGKAIGLWILVMLLGFALAKPLSRHLHRLGSNTSIALLSLALAMMLAGLLEMAGLAMVIGAYTAGLILSRTDLTYLIQEELEPIQRFLVPIFFCVMGMFIDLRVMLVPEVILVSLIYTLLAVVGKFVGCFVPALFLNFNSLGASRIAVGMIPRGEIALIIAGVGISSGIITREIFSIAVVMTFFTTLLTPPVLNYLLSLKKEILKKPLSMSHETLNLRFEMPNPETAEFVHSKFLQSLRREGFFAHRHYHGLYTLTKGERLMTMHYDRKFTEFNCNASDETFVYVLYHEVMSELNRFIAHLKSVGNADQISRRIIVPHEGHHSKKLPGVFGRLSPFAIEQNLKGTTREEITESLMGLPVRSGDISQEKSNEILKELLQYEKLSSMVLSNGVALPHVHTELVEHIIYAFGVSRRGVDLGDPDGQLTKLFFLALIPVGKHEEHLEEFAELGEFLSESENCQKLLEAESHVALVRFVKSLAPHQRIA